MTRNQLRESDVKKFDANPIFTVDGDGNVAPTTAQSVAQGGSLLIQSANPAATTQYTGYICVYQNLTCKCSTVIGNLDSGENHMKVRSTQYNVKSTAPVGDYTVGATTSDTGVTPIPMASTGDVRVGNGG
jgi:hypothetical protein